MKKIVLILIFSLLFGYGREYPRGLIFDDEDYKKTPLTAKILTRDLKFTPPSFSLKQYSPKVGDQKDTGTCTAWATAYGARTIIESIQQDRKNRLISTKEVFSPFYVYNQIRTQKGCKEGTRISDALRLIKREGVAKFRYFGFDCNREVTNKDRKKALDYKISGYKRLFNIYDKNKVLLVKKAISQNRPIVIGMLTPDSFNLAKEVWIPTKNDYRTRNFGGHAMVVVGYDNRKYGGSFEVMNSWGSDWGNGGFTWIRYKDFNHFVKYGYEIIPKKAPKKVIKLEGEIIFRDRYGKVMSATYNKKLGIYQMDRAYEGGTLFNFFINSKQEAYIYAFGLDSVGKVSDIFPYKNISPFLGYRDVSIPFPSEDTYIRMDNHRGKDYFIILYSLYSLDIDKIKERFKLIKGSIRSRLEKVLKEKLINRNNIKFSNKNIKFKYFSTKRLKIKNNNSIIAIVIEFNHI